MASSFEKSVKGATKIKVGLFGSFVLRSSLELTSATGCTPKDKIHRTYPYSNTLWRTWGRRSLPSLAKQIAGFVMDCGFQEFDHCTPDDQGGIT